MSQNDRFYARIPAAIASVVLLLGSLYCSSGFAQDVASSSSENQKSSDSDLAAVRSESQAFVAAFNMRDAKAVASFWTEHGEFVDDAGHSYVGREAIEKSYAEFFADNPLVEIRITIDSLRQLSDGVAIEDGRAVVEPAPAGSPGVSKYTAVHVKVDGRWLMASVRDTWIESPVAERNAADLEWLVGTWNAEEHGVRTESVIDWVVDGRFLQRSYTTTQLDGTTSSGVQLIGWNPQGEHVQSWDFSPDGGHAVGLWSPIDAGWQAEVHGVTGEGLPTTAVNTLKRLDDNAYMWQSVQRSVGEVALPDTGEVIIKRSPRD